MVIWIERRMVNRQEERVYIVVQGARQRYHPKWARYTTRRNSRGPQFTFKHAFCGSRVRKCLSSDILSYQTYRAGSGSLPKPQNRGARQIASNNKIF